MTEQELQAIKERYRKVEFTGEWKVLKDSEYRDRDKVVAKTYIVASEMHEDDAEFVAHAKQDIPNLLAEVERLHILLNEILKNAEYPETVANLITNEMYGKALEGTI